MHRIAPRRPPGGRTQETGADHAMIPSHALSRGSADFRLSAAREVTFSCRSSGRAASRGPANSSGSQTCRSEEHTSELQSLMRISYAVFCLKKNINTTNYVQAIIDMTTDHRGRVRSK